MRDFEPSTEKLESVWCVRGGGWIWEGVVVVDLSDLLIDSMYVYNAITFVHRIGVDSVLNGWLKLSKVR